MVKIFTCHACKGWEKPTLKCLILETNKRLDSQINVMCHPTGLSNSTTIIYHKLTNILFIDMEYSGRIPIITINILLSKIIKLHTSTVLWTMFVQPIHEDGHQMMLTSLYQAR